MPFLTFFFFLCGSAQAARQIDKQKQFANYTILASDTTHSGLGEQGINNGCWGGVTMTRYIGSTKDNCRGSFRTDMDNPAYGGYYAAQPPPAEWFMVAAAQRRRHRWYCDGTREKHDCGGGNCMRVNWNQRRRFPVYCGDCSCATTTTTTVATTTTTTVFGTPYCPSGWQLVMNAKAHKWIQDCPGSVRAGDCVLPVEQAKDFCDAWLTCFALGQFELNPHNSWPEQIGSGLARIFRHWPGHTNSKPGYYTSDDPVLGGYAKGWALCVNPKRAAQLW